MQKQKENKNEKQTKKQMMKRERVNKKMIKQQKKNKQKIIYIISTFGTTLQILLFFLSLVHLYSFFKCFNAKSTCSIAVIPTTTLPHSI